MNEGRSPAPAAARGLRWGAPALALLLAACQTSGTGTIAQLRNTPVDIKEERVEAVPEKAIEGYRRFVEETPESALKPEAIRRLADLKVEREYGGLAGGAAPDQPAPAPAPPAPERPAPPERAPAPRPAPAGRDRAAEAQAEFEARAAGMRPPAYAPAEQGLVEGTDDLERVGAVEAVALYQKLLKDYPAYERSDQVLYQLARAYEELGRVDEAMQVMDRLAREHGRSRYIDEVQFRRAEYFFTRKRYLDAEEAYGSIVVKGPASSFYQLALYKMGWALYKQELYEKALDRFTALLDHKVQSGYDFARPGDAAERKRMDDTFRVISLSFSNLGGADSVSEYFSRRGRRRYEDAVYGNLAEFYFEKGRYGDASATCDAFVSNNPFHTAAPRFQVRAIEIHLAGGFPTLVIDAKKRFAEAYGPKAAYWRHFEWNRRPEVQAWLKTDLTDLAKHFHALYQSPRQAAEKKTNFEEAVRWYREFLAAFPEGTEPAQVNYLLADLYLEEKLFDLAAQEYERTSYGYAFHERSTQAGYAAIAAWRQHLAGAGPKEKEKAVRETARSSLQFAVHYPQHEKSAIVLGAAADDLYGIQDFTQAASAARRLVEMFPRADPAIMRQAWLVAGHSSYEIGRYSDAENAYTRLLELLPARDKGRAALVDNLASAIYKQGEQANERKDHQAAAQHFLRVGLMAPSSGIRATAEFDAAAALMQMGKWKVASDVLGRFRKLFPGHTLQPEVTKKLAYAYREDGQFGRAAAEYERMEQEAADDEGRREALLLAAELYEKAGDQARTLAAYRRYVDRFPDPVETNLEARTRLAEALRKGSDREPYLAELKQIVAMDAAAGGGRTPRTRVLAAQAALVLAGETFDRFAAVRLTAPFEANLGRKKELMKEATQQLNSLLDYEVGEVTAAAAFYLAEIYAGFSRDLKESERPEGLSALEREEYDLAIEEQAYPFEEKAIATHQSNLELIPRGIYNEWIEKSLRKLASLVPARYDKPEEESEVIALPDAYEFVISRPAAAPREGAGAGKAGS